MADRWTDAELEQLISLGREGVKVKDIAAALGRSAQAVAHKRHRISRLTRLYPVPENPPIADRQVQLGKATVKQILDELDRRGLSVGPGKPLEMRQTKRETGRCHGCGRMIHICIDGRFGRHPVTTLLLPGGVGQCPGAGAFPEPGAQLRGQRPAAKPKPTKPKPRTPKAKRRRRPRELDATQLFAVLADGTEVRVTRAVANIDRLTTCELPRPARDDPHASATKRT